MTQRSNRTRATIEDVAAAANVSVATVSRALRGLPNVAPSTRARVADVAQAMHYRADPAAARLAAGRTRTIVVMVPHLAGWYFSTVVAGVEAVCAETGYDCIVMAVGTIDETNRLLDETNDLDRRIDGVVLVNIPISRSQARSLADRGVTCSTIGARVGHHPNVSIDDVEAARIAVAHLVELGHRRIGLISGQVEDPMNFEVPKMRHRGYLAALEAGGIALDDALVEEGNFGIDGGREAMAALLDRPSPPTAVFAMSDEMAFGALMTLQDRGLAVGRDVSLVGIDDHDVSRVLGLTTVRQHVAEQGASACRELMTAIESPDRHFETVRSPVELVVRSTTGPPAGVASAGVQTSRLS